MSFLFHPAIFWPLLINLAFGIVVGALSKRAIWRFFIWPIIPLVIALAIAIPVGLFSSGEPQGWAIWALICLIPTGLAGCGVGVLIGYFLRRKRTHHHDA